MAAAKVADDGLRAYLEAGHSQADVYAVGVDALHRTVGRRGIEPSAGSRGDSYDSALAESVIGFFETEMIRRRGPWPNARGRGIRDVGMGRLVQHAPSPRTDRLRTTRRVRGTLL